MFLSKAPIRAIVKTTATRLFGTPAPGSIGSNSDAFNCPSHCDVAIIGGGAVGSSIAYWLRNRIHNGLNVVVIEKDKCVSEVKVTMCLMKRLVNLVLLHFEFVLSIRRRRRPYRLVAYASNSRWKRIFSYHYLRLLIFCQM